MSDNRKQTLYDFSCNLNSHPQLSINTDVEAIEKLKNQLQAYFQLGSILIIISVFTYFNPFMKDIVLSLLMHIKPMTRGEVGMFFYHCFAECTLTIDTRDFSPDQMGGENGLNDCKMLALS